MVSDPKEHIENKIKAGAVYVITWDTGRMSMERLNRKMTAIKQTKADLEKQAYDNIKPEALIGDLLHTIGVAYYGELDAFIRIMEKNSGVRVIRMTSAAITASTLKVNLFFGLPQSVSSGGLVIDIDKDLYSVRSIDGDMEKVKAFNMSNGMMGSYLEGGIFEQIFGGQAVSTIHILQYANQEGIKVYQINQSNVNAIIPLLQYDSAKKEMLRDLIAAGHEITIPERDVTISGWTGTGYIILDPADGTGTYMIDGGLAGGYTFYETICNYLWCVIIVCAISFIIIGAIYLLTVLSPTVALFIGIVMECIKALILKVIIWMFYIPLFPNCQFINQAYDYIVKFLKNVVANLLFAYLFKLLIECGLGEEWEIIIESFWDMFF